MKISREELYSRVLGAPVRSLAIEFAETPHGCCYERAVE